MKQQGKWCCTKRFEGRYDLEFKSLINPNRLQH